jgi:hypothetical protein
MDIEPRLEEVLETHLRYHAMFQVPFLRCEPCQALESPVFYLWNVLKITLECLNLRRYGSRGCTLTPQEPPPHVSLGYAILDLRLAGVGNLTYQWQGAHCRIIFRLLISARLMG